MRNLFTLLLIFGSSLVLGQSITIDQWATKGYEEYQNAQIKPFTGTIYSKGATMKMLQEVSKKVASKKDFSETKTDYEIKIKVNTV